MQRPETTQGVSNYGIAEDFPILWQMAQEYEFAERLGGCNSNLHAEIDTALCELWNARRVANEGQQVSR